ILAIMLAGLLAVMFAGVPVAFSFFLVAGLAMFFGDALGMTATGLPALRQLVLGMRSQISSFTFTAIPFFVIMGEVFFKSGIIKKTLDSLTMVVRKVPGRLSIVTLLGGGIFAALSGSSLGNTAMFGSLMVPEMTRRGYSKSLTTGSIMAGGGLAMIIPPSNQAVMLGGIAGIPVAGILLGNILPGILMIGLYCLYVIGICLLRPHYAPRDVEVEEAPSRGERVKIVLRDVIPLLSIFVVIMAVIFSGVGTATEAAAFGAVASYVLVAAYRRFSWRLVWRTLFDSLKTSGMLLIIIACAVGFSQVLSLTGASRDMVAAIMGLVSSKFLIVFLMYLIVFILGLFLEQASIMMVCLPLFMPLVEAYGINEIWFAVIFLIMEEVGQFTPPVGMSLYTMKAVSPPEVSMGDIMRGAVPFIVLDIVAVIIVAAVPALATFIPGLM
ncbi:MAG: TRAP transporter large permease subunit, partial [Actinomycetia bacterium]|nr:TRAP transporter large permease subunit [Actinomycetes bacterium]